MKITLFSLNGSYAHSNLAIRCLREALEREGETDVTIFESTLRDRTASTLLHLYNEGADVYGFSCYIWNIREMLALAWDLHGLLPEARIILGGPEVSYGTERFLHLPFVSSIIKGEGEVAFAKAVHLLEKGEPLPPVMEGVPNPHFEERGIFYRKEEPISSLVYYESSRGCPFSCAFCLSSATAGVRAKTAEDTLADLLEFEQWKEPITVKLVDRTFNFDRERAKTIWRGLLSPAYTKCYHFEICAALMDEESIEILSRFPKGKVRLEVGLQSINKDTLFAIHRKDDSEKVLRVARRIKDLGNVHVHLDLIAGLPHEDFASFGRSFDAAYRACNVLQLGMLKLLYGTVLREKSAEYGMVFMGESPYTVLKTDEISYPELNRLQMIADLLDRLMEKGKFEKSLDFLFDRIPSPFAFYNGFFDYIAAHDGRELQRISQRDLYLYLGICGRDALEHPADGETYLRLLQEDFSAFETRKPPIIPERKCKKCKES